MTLYSVSARALALALCFAAAPALAEDTTTPQPDTSFTVGGDIIVTARSMAGATDTIITSVDRLGPDVVQGQDVDYAWELIGRLPGVELTDFNQGTTSGKFSIRGFNGEGEVNAVKLLIDGVPSNSNDGNMPFIDTLFGLDMAGIELVRGTSDPRYGLHAIAGSANVTSRRGGTYLDSRVSVGSHATYEGQLAAGLERGGFSQNYLIAYRDAGGYRDHGDLNRLSLSGRWAYVLSPALTIGASARAYRGHAEEPGYLTLTDARAHPTMTNAYNATDGDRRRTQQYVLFAQVAASDHLGGFIRGYFNRFRDDRFVKFSAAASQQRRVTREDQWGMIGAAHWHGSISGVDTMLEVGGDVQWQDNMSQRYLSVARVPTSQTRNQQFDMTVGGVYAQLTLEPAPWLRLTPAWRMDWVGGDFRNLLNANRAPINQYGRIDQPKFSVAVLPVDGVTLYANWGRTYQIGLGSGAYLIAPRVINLDPSINEGFEAGVRYAPDDRFTARVAIWRQDASGEIKRKLNDPLGDFENVGATRRQGVDVQLSAHPIAQLSLWGAIAYQTTEIVRPDPATPLLAGNEIDHSPHWLFSGGVDVAFSEQFDLSVWLGGQSDYELTTSNNRGRFGDYATVNAEMGYAVNPAVRLSLSVKNMTGTDYEYVWWDGAQSLHSPADQASVTASLRVRL